MPLYEYYCQSCGYLIEIIHKVSEKKYESCPSCQKILKKKTSLTTFQLKGGGWYKDSYSKPVVKNSENKLDPKKSKDKSTENKIIPSAKKESKNTEN